MKLWLDDLRPDVWVHARSAVEAIALLEAGALPNCRSRTTLGRTKRGRAKLAT